MMKFPLRVVVFALVVQAAVQGDLLDVAAALKTELVAGIAAYGDPCTGRPLISNTLKVGIKQ